MSEGKFTTVTAAEAGQKLLRFLSRRLNLPSNLLHRWIRSGQIRRNGHRCQPFDRLEIGDQIRLPPQARQMAENGEDNAALSPLPPLPPLLGKEGGIWAYNKPANVPVQGGTGQTDSICRRLAWHFRNADFVPAPAHRLDRETSGVLLVGATYGDLRQLHDWFARGQMRKEYLCWVRGQWNSGAAVLRHWLIDAGGIKALEQEVPGATLALCIAQPLLHSGHNTLLQVRLLTGRKRQIRAQLAALGHPILGDGRYGAQGDLKLHCARITLPTSREFYCLPPWTGKFALDTLPPMLKNGEPGTDAGP